MAAAKKNLNIYLSSAYNTCPMYYCYFFGECYDYSVEEAHVE
jgi:hypothetical protein